MQPGVSHDRVDESPAAKARWFRSLPLSDRMDLLCFFTDLALTVNPGLADREHAEQTAGRVRITIFKDRVRIDVQTSTPGLTFAGAWERRQSVQYEGQRFFIVSRDDLIASKRASGGPVDLEDVRLLESTDDGAA